MAATRSRRVADVLKTDRRAIHSVTFPINYCFVVANVRKIKSPRNNLTV